MAATAFVNEHFDRSFPIMLIRLIVYWWMGYERLRQESLLYRTRQAKQVICGSFQPHPEDFLHRQRLRWDMQFVFGAGHRPFVYVGFTDERQVMTNGFGWQFVREHEQHLVKLYYVHNNIRKLHVRRKVTEAMYRTNCLTVSLCVAEDCMDLCIAEDYTANGWPLRTKQLSALFICCVLPTATLRVKLLSFHRVR